jgi:hypothetical protein
MHLPRQAELFPPEDAQGPAKSYQDGEMILTSHTVSCWFYFIKTPSHSTYHLSLNKGRMIFFLPLIDFDKMKEFPSPRSVKDMQEEEKKCFILAQVILTRRHLFLNIT